jgi:CheY-like chemotaxis protein
MGADRKQQDLILAVDDNRNALEIIRRTLNQFGHNVITCEGVQDAVDVMAKSHIDLVITDLKMPKHNGLELV